MKTRIKQGAGVATAILDNGEKEINPLDLAFQIVKGDDLRLIIDGTPDEVQLYIGNPVELDIAIRIGPRIIDVKLFDGDENDTVDFGINQSTLPEFVQELRNLIADRCPSTSDAASTGGFFNGSTGVVVALAPDGGAGADGDFYLDRATGNVYGPKTGGAWGTAR